MKVLVCGDRHWDDGSIVMKRLRELPRGTRIITGGALGADYWAEETTRRFTGFKLTVVKADWFKYGKAAGPIRNKKMLDMEPDLVIAFHNDIENSLGTKNCIKEAEKRGIEIELISKIS